MQDLTKNKLIDILAKEEGLKKPVELCGSIHISISGKYNSLYYRGTVRIIPVLPNSSPLRYQIVNEARDFDFTFKAQQHPEVIQDHKNEKSYINIPIDSENESNIKIDQIHSIRY